MSEPIKNMKCLTDKLAAIDAPISEEDQVVTLLGSLPSSYANIVTALEARVDNLTLQFAQQSLINEELKQDMLVESQPDRVGGDSALLSQKQTKRKKPIICYSCGKPGHKRPQCPERTQQEAKQAAEHAALSNDEEQVFFAGGKLPGQTLWLIDSGATCHMTPHRSAYIDFKKLDVAQKVSLGDGRTVQAIGKGAVKIMLTLGSKVK